MENIGREAEKLNRLASEIRAAFGAADNQRLIAARLLLEAEALFRTGVAGGMTWAEWCEKNTGRSARDCRRLMAIARADDPVKALEEERARSRQSARQSRATRTCMSGDAAKAGSASEPPKTGPSPEAPKPTTDEGRLHLAVQQAKALRETLSAIENHDKRARAVALVDTVLDDVWADVAYRIANGSGEIKRDVWENIEWRVHKERLKQRRAA